MYKITPSVMDLADFAKHNMLKLFIAAVLVFLLGLLAFGYRGSGGNRPTVSATQGN